MKRLLPFLLVLLVGCGNSHYNITLTNSKHIICQEWGYCHSCNKYICYDGRGHYSKYASNQIKNVTETQEND